MYLEILRASGDTDVYDIAPKGVELSPVLAAMIPEQEEGESEDEEADEGQLRVRLPVTFEDQYMKIIENYLNYFARESLPLIIATPLTSKKAEDLLHPRIYEWLQDYSLDTLARFRQICMYFEVDPLIEQVDAILAIAIVANPKEVFQTFHEPNLTLASKDSVSSEFPILD
jgi:hypothetical protein